MADLSIKEGDTEPVLEATLQRDGTGFDLSTVSNPSVTVVIGATDNEPQASGECEIVDAPNGVVEYDWVDGDTSSPGVYQCEFVVRGDSMESTFPSEGYSTVHIQSEVRES